MDVTLASQVQGFVASLVVGALLGLYYDVFRLYRTMVKCEKTHIFFQDVFYFASSALLVFLLARAVNYGEVRFYILLGVAVGWCVYHFTVGLLTIRIFTAVIHFFSRWIFRPLRMLFTAIFHWLAKCAKKVGKFLKNTAVKLKNRLKRHKKIVYNQSNHSGQAKRRRKFCRKARRDDETDQKQA